MQPSPVAAAGAPPIDTQTEQRQREGQEDIDAVEHDQQGHKRQATEVLAYFVAYCHHHGLAAKGYLAFGTDPIEELTNLAEKIYSEFPHSIFFTSKLIFERDNWYIRQLHSEAALTMLLI